jgi:glycosyltransferase involved in cell wall biosynthesis
MLTDIPVSGVRRVPPGSSEHQTDEFATGRSARRHRLEGGVPGRLAVILSTHGVDDLTAPFVGSGSRVASVEWTRAFLRHGMPTGMDVFVPFIGAEQSREPFLSLPRERADASRSDVHVLHDSDLPLCVSAGRYSVLHSISTDLTTASYARARFARSVVPVTCPQYAISYKFQLHDCFIKLLSTQIYQCDAVVCSTDSSKRAMALRLGDISERYASFWQGKAPTLPRLEVIPWGVDTSRLAPQDQTLARRDLDLPLDRPIVLCIGRVRIEDKMDWSPLLLCLANVSRATCHRNRECTAEWPRRSGAGSTGRWSGGHAPGPGRTRGRGERPAAPARR